MARPKLDIDPKEVEAMAATGCNNCDIADYFGCDEGTIRKGFSEILRKTRARLRRDLRAKQIEIALVEGDRALLIWLGKQMLNQADKTYSVNEGQIEFKGAVIAAPEYTDEQKEAYARYKRQAMGSN